MKKGVSHHFREMVTDPFFFLLLGVFLFSSSVRAEETVIVGDDGVVKSAGQQEDVVKARATMASLFGKNAVIAVPPRIAGSMALPPFDSKNMEIDRETVKEDQRLKTED